MKAGRFLFTIFVISLSITACGSNNSGTNTSDTAKANKKRADTAIVPGDQKNIKNDSLSGDPSSKGSADPNAKLPKK